MSSEHDYAQYVAALSDLLDVETRRLTILQGAETEAERVISETKKLISEHTKKHTRVLARIGAIDQEIATLRHVSGFPAEPNSSTDSLGPVTAIDVYELQTTVEALAKQVDAIKLTIARAMFGDMLLMKGFSILTTRQELDAAVTDIIEAESDLARLRTAGGFSAEPTGSDANGINEMAPSLAYVANTLESVKQQIPSIERKLRSALKRQDVEQARERERREQEERWERELHERKLARIRKWLTIAGVAILTVVTIALLIIYNDTVRGVAKWTFVVLMTIVMSVLFGLSQTSQDKENKR